MILYADILFLVDLSMDYLTLFLCARLSHRPTRWYRMLLAAAAGAISSVLLTVLSAGRFFTLLCGLTLSILMTILTFGTMQTLRAFGKQCLMVWGSGTVIGGCMSVLLSLGEPIYLETGQESQQYFLPLFMITAGTVYYLVHCMQKRASVLTAVLKLEWHGRSAEVCVLIDSGNLLTDPLTGRPVILLSAQAAVSLELPTCSTENWSDRIYPVAAKGMQGTRLLWAVMPSLLTVNGQPRDALVAVEDVPADHYGGWSGTCPVCLV